MLKGPDSLSQSHRAIFKPCSGQLPKSCKTS
nr:MAG TPA: hypothetical protein [Caudoviricetes sp.]